MNSAEIFHRGCKTFWKTHTKVDVLIAEHKHCDMLEIVCSDPTTRQQAPRIYVQKSVLKSDITDDEIQSRVIALIESIQARKQDFDRDVLLAQAWKAAIYEYIEERLELHKKFVGSKAFHVTLRESLFAEGTQETVTCKAPASLVCFDLPWFALPRESVLQLAQGNSVAGTAHLDTLSARDRLRIPFVFIKTAKAKYLSRSDARIWKVITLLILRDIEVHGRQAIINLESTTLCAEFAARQLARMRSTSVIPSSSNKYAKSPVLDALLVSEGSSRRRDHRSKPSTPRYAEPDSGSTRSVSSKLGLDAIASSVQRGLQSLGSSKHNAASRTSKTGGGRRPSRSAAEQEEEPPLKKSMVSMMMGGKSRRGSRTDKPQMQRAPSRNHQRGSRATTPHGDALSARSTSGFSDAGDDEEMGFVNDADSSSARRPGGSDRKEWFGGMSKKLTGLVSGKFSAFSGSSKHRMNRVGVSADDRDDDTLSQSHTAPTSSDGASVVTVDPAFAPIGGLGGTIGSFLSNLSGKHTASTVVKVKSAREKPGANSSAFSGKSTFAGAAATPVPVAVPHRVTDSALAQAPQLFQHITMWGGRVTIRAATSKAKRDIVFRLK